MIEQMRKKIDHSLALFLRKARQEYHFDLIDPRLYASIEDFVLRKGKRIRPLLLVCSYKGYKQSPTRMTPSIYYVSTCIELLHNFMLVHDDIIDCSALRRGRPTMHKMLEKTVPTKNPEKLGTDLAIVSGDILYALAIDAFLSINEDRGRKEQALRYFIQTAVLTAMGEFLDTQHGVQALTAVKEKDVFLNYSLKTARYTFECPLVVGAILAGSTPREIKYLSELGLLIGQAFQIQDDIIGIFDSQKNIGKSNLSDIAESKKTLLVCHAHRVLRGAARQKFLLHFNKPRPGHRDLLEIRKILQTAGSLEYCLREVEQRLARAQAIFSRLTMRPQYLRYIQQSLITLFDHSKVIAKQYRLPFQD